MTGPLPRLREQASGTLVVGLSGPDPRGAELARVGRLAPAGVILFARNVENAAQLRHLCLLLRESLDAPLVLIDQEGGRVDRLRRLLDASPPARRLAALGPEAVLRHAENTAHALSLLGVGFNCAPVLDLDEGDPRNGLADRCLSSDPLEAARLARLVLRAHARHGVLTSLKHFPGLGRTDADTHAVRPTVNVSRAALVERELLPFRLLLDEAPSVMACHAAFPALTGDDGPACLSPRVVTELLRRDLGYGGLVLTDDLEMGAVADRTPEERSVAAIAAGCDLLLWCSDLDAAECSREALVEAVSSGRLPESRLAEAAARARAARRSVGHPPAWSSASQDALARIAAARREALT